MRGVYWVSVSERVKRCAGAKLVVEGAVASGGSTGCVHGRGGALPSAALRDVLCVCARACVMFFLLLQFLN